MTAPDLNARIHSQRILDKIIYTHYHTDSDRQALVVSYDIKNKKSSYDVFDLTGHKIAPEEQADAFKTLQISDQKTPNGPIAISYTTLLKQPALNITINAMGDLVSGIWYEAGEIKKMVEYHPTMMPGRDQQPKEVGLYRNHRLISQHGFDEYGQPANILKNGVCEITQEEHSIATKSAKVAVMRNNQITAVEMLTDGVLERDYLMNSEIWQQAVAKVQPTANDYSYAG